MTEESLTRSAIFGTVVRFPYEMKCSLPRSLPRSLPLSLSRCRLTRRNCLETGVRFLCQGKNALPLSLSSLSSFKLFGSSTLPSMRLDPRPHLRVDAPPVTGHWPLVTHHPPRYAYLGPSCSWDLDKHSASTVSPEWVPHRDPHSLTHLLFTRPAATRLRGV